MGTGAAGNATKALVAAIAASLLISLLPFGGVVGWPLGILQTFSHELGHALGALVSGGSVESIELFARGGGLAHTSTSGELAHLVVLVFGLVGPALFAGLFFFLALRDFSARAGLLLVGLGFLLTTLLWVRTVWGFAVVGAAGLALIWIARRKDPLLHQGAAVFLALQFAMSVFNGSGYLFRSGTCKVGGREIVTDIQKVADILGGPVFFWGLLVAGFSFGVLVVGGLMFLRTMTSGASDGRAS